MKKAQMTVRDALSALDPATTSMVVSLDLILRNGRTFKTNDVTVENDGTVLARSESDADTWLHIQIDEIVGYETLIHRERCIDEKVEPTLGAVLDHSMKR